MMLTKPVCRTGYPEYQLKEILQDRLPEFFSWMRGQTFSICNGEEYDHEVRMTVPTGCGPHGYVYYSWDVERFLKGLPVID